jgi:tRNA dimethylallyltransferase
MLGEKQKLAVLIGPTAVGKTKLSIQLAKELNAEIISGDSMQIYREMDIGTAKITQEEMEGVPHHLIDIKNPDESFSTAEFQQLVRGKIDEIAGRGRLPMIVGGTGLYIQSVIYDYEFADKESDSSVRDRLEREAEENGIEALYERLKQIDPAGAGKIHMNNKRRVIRALEVYETTGKPFGEHIASQEHKLLYDVALVGLTMEREQLYTRINKRVDIMVEQGLVEEVKRLYEQGIRHAQSIQAIGYKEMYQYLEQHLTLEEAVEQLKQNSRRYAKRQLTWFRNKMTVQWFDLSDGLSDGKFHEIFTYIAGKLRLGAN